MSMIKLRRAYEVLFLGLFLFFLLLTDLRYLKGWPVSWFLEATPLVAIATALTTHTIYRNLFWGLAIIGVTLVVGRVWCNWICPFGILHHLFGWLGNRRNTKQMIEVNRYRKLYAVKYYILAAMIAMTALWIVPTILDAPGQSIEIYRGTALKSKGAARVVDEGKIGRHLPVKVLLDANVLQIRRANIRRRRHDALSHGLSPRGRGQQRDGQHSTRRKNRVVILTTHFFPFFFPEATLGAADMGAICSGSPRCAIRSIARSIGMRTVPALLSM